MRETEFLTEDVSAKIKYPNDIIFAFNPNYIEFSEVTGAKFVTIACGKEEINVEFYGGSARADISLLLQTQFVNPIEDRTKAISVDLIFDGEIGKETRVDLLAIWGSSSIGERLNSIGAYHFDKTRQKFVRNVRWFVNYPQKLSVFDNRTFNDFYPTKTVYDYDLDTSTVEKVIVFDHTFDSTFIKNFNINSYLDAKVILHQDEAKDGYFLRWMDNLGMYQYFLFRYGERTVKPKQEHSVQSRISVGGYDFGGGSRMLTHKQEIEYKGCAMHLTHEESLYVQTILNSPFVDLYQGTMQGGEELWVPVVLIDQEKKISERKELVDLEIAFTIPTSKPQQL